MDDQEIIQMVEITVTLTRQEIESLGHAAKEKNSDLENFATRIVQAWLVQIYRPYQMV